MIPLRRTEGVKEIFELFVGNARRSVPRCRGAVNSNGFATLQGTEQRPFPTELLIHSHLHACSAPLLNRAADSFGSPASQSFHLNRMFFQSQS